MKDKLTTQAFSARSNPHGVGENAVAGVGSPLAKKTSPSGNSASAMSPLVNSNAGGGGGGCCVMS
jgi:hypothetical protein